MLPSLTCFACNRPADGTRGSTLSSPSNRYRHKIHMRVPARTRNLARVTRRRQARPRAHNVRDPAVKRSRVQVVYNFGQEEPGTREALERLVACVARHLEQELSLASTNLAAVPETAATNSTSSAS